MAKARCSLFCIYEDLYLLDRNKEEVIELYFYSAKKSANLHASIRVTDKMLIKSN
jgi:hypothetical protein